MRLASGSESDFQNFHPSTVGGFWPPMAAFTTMPASWYARICLNPQFHLQKSILTIKPAFVIWIVIGSV
jgi:hypothetical protein